MDVNKTVSGIRKKRNKRLDGWNTSLPYGIASNLGIDTTDMSPREVWEKIEKATNESPSTFYKKKEKAGEGTDVKIQSINEEAVEKIYQNQARKKNVDPHVERVRQRIDHMKGVWVRDCNKMSDSDVRSQIKDCESQINSFKKNPEKFGENLALAIERKAILKKELEWRESNDGTRMRRMTEVWKDEAKKADKADLSSRVKDIKKQVDTFSKGLEEAGNKANLGKSQMMREALDLSKKQLEIYQAEQKKR